ncbi:MAG: VWA domain-containing protein [Gammaproteobacteria bacterium]|nr:VWA domain-containing protein [Gammaproteobacteria bacterium]
MAFVAPLFLLGLVGLLAPWLLHRLNERNAPVQDFPSDQFLEPTRSIRARQKKLRYLRLLGVRLLALLLLCLLFAQPLIKQWDLLSGNEPVLNLLAVDQSFSMRAGERGSRAQELVSAILDDIPADMPIQLVGIDGAASTVVAATRDREEIVQGINSLQPGFSTTDYTAVMRQLNALAERQDLPVHVHLLTDLQDNAMPARLNDLRAPRLSQLKLWNVATDAPVNSTLQAEVVPVDDRGFSVDVTVRRYGYQGEVSGQRVRLSAPGEDSLELEVPAEADEQKITFENLQWPVADRSLQYTLTLLPGDELADDDVVTLPVQAETSAEVRVIDSVGSGTQTASDAWLYLNTAFSLDATLNVTRASADNTDTWNTAEIIVFVDNTPLIEGALPELPDRLERFLDNGGTVLYVLNTTESGSLASRVSREISHVDFVDETHPLSLDASNWHTVDFYVHQSLVPGSAEILMSTEEGYPVLLESQREKGKLVWLNAALNGSDNNLPVSPVFVPFLHNLAHYYLFHDRYPTHLRIGENVKLGQSVQLLDPAGDSLLKLSESVGGSTHVLSRPGIYTILDQLGEHPVIVTPDPLESDIRVAAATAVEAWQSVIVSGSEVPSTEDDTATTPTAGGASNEAPLLSLTRWLLPLCLLLFVLEALFANYHLRVRRA